MDLTGQVVIVTGSSSGIGEEVARRLDAIGAGVVVNSATSVEAGEKVASQLRDAVYLQGDISDPSTAEALVRVAADRWGRLDGLVNNAGVTVTVPLADLDNVRVEHWEKVLRTNVIGTFLVSQACLPLLRAAPEGWIVNITSLAGTRQTGSSFPYAVSKAAVNHMTTLLAKFVGSNVRVNGVAPGLVATPWTATWDDRKQAVEATAPLHRVATPEDIADATLAVISCRYASGSTLIVDGGLGLVI
jgi:ketoreductase RED2